ncbi:MAG: sigma-70 family RNA polymerase sigma factor [Verrucomicrobiae bacterium]|nr:sigma-70 family RNA polymerase sigma factor [Verrucomicrobiae bacterium]
MTTPAAPASDQELLRCHAQDASGEAFAELVHRHLNLVHAAALRQMNGHGGDAADVVQEVFLELSRKAGRVSRHPAPLGWLYTTTRRMAMRRIHERQRREQQDGEAFAMQSVDSDNEPPVEWERLGPMLDEAMHELREPDRLAILWRYFERRSFPEIGARLGLGGNGARMRVERALEKLRARLKRRGITSSASAIGLAIEGSAVTAAPAGLASLVHSVALAPAAAMAPVSALLVFMNSSLFKAGVTTVVIGLLGTGVWIQRDRLQRLRLEAEALRQELAESQDRLAAAEAHLQEPSARDNERDALQQELLRLRGELARLRREAAQSPRKPSPLPTADTPARPLPAPIRATLPAGHSLVAGGLDWTDGRHALVILTPTHRVGDDGQVLVDVESRILLMTDAVMDEFGFRNLGTSPNEGSSYQPLTDAERSELLSRMENRPDIETLGNLQVTTPNSRQAAVATMSDDLPAVMAFDIIPTVTADGQVDMTLMVRTEPKPSEPDKSP